jgi:hypothetical protein
MAGVTPGRASPLSGRERPGRALRVELVDDPKHGDERRNAGTAHHVAGASRATRPGCCAGCLMNRARKGGIPLDELLARTLPATSTRESLRTLHPDRRRGFRTPGCVVDDGKTRVDDVQTAENERKESPRNSTGLCPEDSPGHRNALPRLWAKRASPRTNKRQRCSSTRYALPGAPSFTRIRRPGIALAARS